MDEKVYGVLIYEITTTLKVCHEGCNPVVLLAGDMIRLPEDIGERLVKQGRLKPAPLGTKEPEVWKH